jgi:DNA-binding NtrC family response regulator
MAMRGTVRRARSPITIAVRTFGWDRAVVATLRHSTLPWFETFGSELMIDATPIGALNGLGDRDRLSLIGQFAAHQAFLQFAGVPDGEWEAGEWAVVQKRATDCRLVRLAGRSFAGDAPPVLTVIQQFAAGIGAPALDVLRQSWARAESVYREVDARLRSDAAADLRWLRSAACGLVRSPGPEGLRNVLAQGGGRFRFSEDLCVESFRAMGERVVILGENGSPAERYSGIAPLRAIVGRFDGDREVVERVVAAAAQARMAFVLRRMESLDPGSRRVIDLLLASEVGVWIGVNGGAELPESTFFLLSPRLEAHRHFEDLLQRLPIARRQMRLDELVQSPGFARYLDDGELHALEAPALAAVGEPLRSYIATVSLLGCRVPRQMVDGFLQRLLSTARSADLVVDGVTAVEESDFVFASEMVREQAMQSIPTASRASLCRVAAEIVEQTGSSHRAALLLQEAGDTARAVHMLEQIEWQSGGDTMRILRSIPRGSLSPRLARTLAEAMIESGRYRDAREIASALPADLSELLLARIERRTGHAEAALARVERMQPSDFDSQILRAELLSLTGRYDDARIVLNDCQPHTDGQRVRVGYERAMLANEIGAAADDDWLAIDVPAAAYYAFRIAACRALAVRDLPAAIQSAHQAIAHALSVPQRIDATLDLLFALFCSGRWIDARAAALDALLLVDQTQGDRAAAGILFMLAFLAADDGQHAHASHLLNRLRQFYTEMHDQQRLRELDIIVAHIDFARGRFDSAFRAASVIVTGSFPRMIREAAALILDEIDWIEHRVSTLRSTGGTANVELTDRHELLRARQGMPERSGIQGSFARTLADWERDGGERPAAASGSQRLMIFRSALALRRHQEAAAMAQEMNITMAPAAERAAEAELRVLRDASVHQFPYSRHDFGPLRWRFATRNRLGQWQEIGSVPPSAAGELDAILALPCEDWVVCSDRQLLYVDGLDSWSAESREALASIVRIRAEHHRMRRLLEQEEAQEERRAAIDGIVGQSPAMLELFGVVARVARRDVPVCILGESGTGKELVARAIHRQSPRKQKSFTAINCAALPENLIESELFGHARGAFTGADRERPGLIETTDGGTLFLDEIGEMPPAAQAKLLRFLQEGEFRRIGDTVSRTADVRVVTATNRKLEAAVEQGGFREDLYYRIRGVEMVLPPLRERAGDIALLASHFLGLEREKHRGGPARLSQEVEAVFSSYHWPGNVRELQNTIRAAHALAGDAKEIDLDNLPERLRGVRAARLPLGSYQDAVARFRRELIEKSLAHANGNQNRAAAMLKISRQALAYQIRELGILVTASKRPRL